MKKHFIRILILGAFVALLLRLGVSWELAGVNGGKNPVYTPHPATDMFTYRTLAKKIAEGSYTGEFYYQPFYYAVFLPAIRLIAGESVWAVIIIQAFLGALTVYFAALTAGLLWSRTAGVITLIATACSEMLILYTPFHLNETLQAFWLVLLFYLCVRGIQCRKQIYWMAAAIVTGCSILTRGNMWFLVPGIIVVAFVNYRRASENRESPKVFLRTALLLVLVLLPQMPFIWHNTVLQGKLTGPSTGAGPNLAIGNTPEAPPGGRNPDLTAGPTEYPPTYLSWTESGNSIPVITRIRQWALAEPLAFLELTFRKFLLFWDHREIPDNISRVGEGSSSVLLRIGGFCYTGFIIVPALAGMMLLAIRTYRKCDLKMLLLYSLVLSYWLGTSIFFILARFRVPVIPLLAIFAGIFVDRFIRIRKKRSRVAYLTGILALGIGIFISFSAYSLYQENLEASVMRNVRPDGVRVRLSEERMMVLDHGPFTFGGWTTQRFDESTTIVKQFTLLEDREAQRATLELALFFERPGRATFLINGEERIVNASSPGSVTPEIQIPKPVDHRVTIKLLSASSQIYFIVDRQRDYGRTLINQEKSPGELVCRLYLMSDGATSRKQS